MRINPRALLAAAAAIHLLAVPARAQELDPCTGKPREPLAQVPVHAPPPPAPAPPAPPPPPPADPYVCVFRPDSLAPSLVPAVRPDTGDVVDRARAERTRRALRLGAGALEGQVRLGPAASVSVPTAFGVEWGELFVGVAYQGRTRFTDDDDAAAVAGVGFGSRRTVGVELALTSYSTLRGAPLETGGVSVKVHRAVGDDASVAVGWENALLWGGSDADGTLYAAGTRIFSLRRDPSRPFGLGVLTVGAGNGRFRFEDDVADGNETVNVFAAAGLRVTDPLSFVADWTGQDLNAAASLVPLRRVPLVITAGVADLTGTAGDGARFILSVGYGLSIRQPL